MYRIYKTFEDKVTVPKKITNDCWLDINSPSEDELFELKSVIDIPEDIILSIRDADEVPKVEKYDDFNFILIQTPVMKEEVTDDSDEEPDVNFSVAPLGIIYTPNGVVTLSEGQNDIIEYLRVKLKNYSRNHIINTDNTPQFILKLLLFTAKTYLRHLKIINQKIRAAQSALEKSPQNDEIITLMNLEKSLVYFSTSLHSNHIVFEKIAKRKSFTSNEEDEELVEDILDESKQALETVKIYGKIVGNVSNTFAAIISNNLNKTVRLLTAITMILTIPMVVASVYGMNVELPFQHSPYAFIITLVISTTLALLTVFVFFRKKLF